MKKKEIWKTPVRHGVLVPGYKISNFGRVMSLHSKKILKPRIIFRGGIKPKSLSVDLSIPNNLYTEYTHRKSKNSSKNTTRLKMTVLIHRLVIETFKPIEHNLPEGLSKEDWDTCSDTVKKLISECFVVDHIDDDATNNHVENLRWTTPKENSPHRKHGNGSKYHSVYIKAKMTHDSNILKGEKLRSEKITLDTLLT